MHFYGIELPGLHHRYNLHQPIIFLVSYDTSDSSFYGWCRSSLCWLWMQSPIISTLSWYIFLLLINGC